MSATSKIRSWWKALLRRDKLESEMESELRFHMERYAADLMQSGVEREESMRRARVELGTLASQKEDARDAIGLRPWDDLRADLRYAFRQLRNAPGFTLTVVMVLALGIGANAAMLSIVDATLLRWLPYSRPSELLSLTAADSKGNPTFTSYADFEDWQSRPHSSLAALACYTPNSGYLRTPGGDQLVDTPDVSAGFFDVLGTPTAMGRGFLAEEQVPGKGKVIVLSDPVWRSMFQSDPAIVGKQVAINDVPYTVVGVMPPRFAFPVDSTAPQVWVPTEVTAKHHLRDFSTSPCQVIARMKKGAGIPAVRAELSGIQKQLAVLYAKEIQEQDAPSRVEATAYRDTLVKDSRPALRALLLAVAIIWLIACVNVANLMLARGMARQQEMAVRGALGASRWRLVRQLFTESLVLSAAGGLAGLALAQGILELFNKALSARLRLPEHLVPNTTVLAALLGLSVLSALVFGLLPAWLTARTPIENAMREGTRQAGGSRGRRRLQQGMVVAEIGLSLVLLIACGLMLRTVFALRRVPLGFRTDHVVMVQPAVPNYKYRGADMTRAVYRPVLEKIQQMNGVRAASLTTVLPLRKGFDIQVTLYVGHGERSTSAATHIEAKLRAAGPELKDVLGFRM